MIGTCVVPKLEKRTNGESVTKYGTIQYMVPIGILTNFKEARIQEYCKTLIIRVTLFSRNHRSSFIHETLFSRLVISSSIILTLQIIGEDFIFASLCFREFTRK